MPADAHDCPRWTTRSQSLSRWRFEVRYEQWALLKTIKQSKGSFCAKLSLSISVLQRKRTRSDAGKNRGGSRSTRSLSPTVGTPASANISLRSAFTPSDMPVIHDLPSVFVSLVPKNSSRVRGSTRGVWGVVAPTNPAPPSPDRCERACIGCGKGSRCHHARQGS